MSFNHNIKKQHRLFYYMHLLKIIRIAIICLLFTACVKEKKTNIDYETKYTYIENRFPLLLNNLNKKEIDSFINVMKFNEQGILSSLDIDLLKKGSKKEFKNYIVNFTKDLGSNVDYIAIINEVGEEEALINNYFTNTSNEEIPLSEIESWDGLFVITSLRCGHCLEFFKTLNNLSSSDVKLVALFPQSSIILENYKKGTAYSNFGFLNNNWNIFFNSEDIVKQLLPEYSDKTDGFPFVFYRKHGKTIKLKMDMNFFTEENLKLLLKKYN